MRDRWIRASKWNRHHEWPTMQKLRRFIFHADQNGLGEAIKKIEDKFFIQEKMFFEWAKREDAF